MIADLPGFNLDGNPQILEEARRAHLVVFLCDSDITRSQMEQLQGLLSIQKPLIVALNKMDRFSGPKRVRSPTIFHRRTGVDGKISFLSKRVAAKKSSSCCAMAARKSLPAERTQDIEPLRLALQRKLDGDHQLMEQSAGYRGLAAGLGKAGSGP